MAKVETTYAAVKMDDGRVVDFPGKRKLLKDTKISSEGKVEVRFDFVNGETRTFTIPDSLLLQFAGHGAEQKFGDECAGLTEIEDMVMAIDELMDRMVKGEWAAQRAAGNSMAGSSVLAKALCEASGKPFSEIKEFLKGKSQNEKLALREAPAIKPIVQKLEAAKAKKASTVDTSSLLDQLGVGAPQEAAAE